MENPEEIQLVLERYSRVKPKEIPEELEEYLTFVAKTGDTVFKWPLIQYLFREKLLSVITEFHNTTPSIADIPHYPNVDPFNYELMKKMLIERMESFPSAPFTIQRICELLTEPRKQYSRIDKFMRAIEKNILVVSTLEPGRARHESENGESMDSTINGDLLGDGHVDVGGGGDDLNDVPLETTLDTHLETEFDKDDESGTSADHAEGIIVPLEKLVPEVNVLTVDPLSTEDNENKTIDEQTAAEDKPTEITELQTDEEIKVTIQDTPKKVESVQEDTKEDKISVKDPVDQHVSEDVNLKEKDEITSTEEKVAETVHETVIPEHELKEDKPALVDLPIDSTAKSEQKPEDSKEATDEIVPQELPTEQSSAVVHEPVQSAVIEATHLEAITTAEEPTLTEEVSKPVESPVQEIYLNPAATEMNPVDVVDMETDIQPSEDQKLHENVPFGSTPEFVAQKPTEIISTDVMDMETDQQHIEASVPTLTNIPFEQGSEQIFDKQEAPQETTNDVVDMETADTQVNNTDSKNEMMQGFL